MPRRRCGRRRFPSKRRRSVSQSGGATGMRRPLVPRTTFFRLGSNAKIEPMIRTERTSEREPAAANLPKTMKAAVVDAAGPPNTFRIADVPVPRLKRDHAIIALDFASVGIWDATERAGDWRDITPGTILGADGAGIVVAAGRDVEHLRVGDRVYAYSYDNPDGGFYAEDGRVRTSHAASVQ